MGKGLELMRKRIGKRREEVMRKQIEGLKRFNEFLERAGKNTKDPFS